MNVLPCIHLLLKVEEVIDIMKHTHNYRLNSYSVTIPEGFRPPNLQHLTFHDLKYIQNLDELQTFLCLQIFRLRELTIWGV